MGFLALMIYLPLACAWAISMAALGCVVFAIDRIVELLGRGWRRASVSILFCHYLTGPRE